MKEYFLLQLTLLNRRLKDFGLPPWLAYMFIPGVFYLFSEYLFSKTELAGYFYIVLAFGLLSRLNEPQRNTFLKVIFGKKQYLILRCIENFIWASPFFIFLIYKGQFYFLLFLGISIVGMVVVKFSPNIDFTIPTPFGKRPFEFTEGFRKTFLFFLLVYYLTYEAVSANNGNLGIFAMILVSLVCSSYYVKPEEDYFVWIHNVGPRRFLFEKTKIGILFFLVLTAPIVFTLLICFFEDSLILLSSFVLCVTYLILVILAKYSVFPAEMNVPQMVMVALGLALPPALIIIVPFLLSQSKKNLKPLLHDQD